MVEKFINAEGRVAVLYSPGFGAGWSTWGGSDREFMLFAKPLVELALKGVKPVRANTLEEIDALYPKVRAVFEGAGLDCPYLGGWRDIQVAWLEPGTQFQVEEYDGAESLRVSSQQQWITA